MKIALSLMAVLLLGACAPGSKGGGSAPVSPRPAPAPGPTPETELQWGELACQRRAACKDPVLNQSLERIVAFVSRNRGRMPAGDLGPYYCGRLLGRAWENEIGGSGFDAHLDNFFSRMFDPSDCAAKPEWRENFRNYFKNHQEYKK
jgi:hypothetical protein